jgi:predicted nucleotidyltransferase
VRDIPKLAALVRNLILSLSEELILGDCYMFGSVLSSKTPNDVDILIVIDENVVATSSAYHNAGSFLKAIETESNLPVDLTILTTSELAQSNFATLVDALLIRKLKIKGSI